MIAGSNGTGAYTYVQYDLRGLNNGSDNISFAGNFTFGDSEIDTGIAGGVAHYGSSASTYSATLNAGVGPSYFSGLVGNAIINAPLWKLYGTASLA